LAVHLETPGGEGRVVRCCLPGELVGESSLLETERPTCNATITAREASQLWCFDGGALKDVLEEVPDLRARIEAKRTIHRLDSFFSMNEATNTLDVRVRDKLLGCISTIRYARAGEVLESEGALPSTVYLLVTGRIEYQRPKAAVRIYGPDSFVCLKDTLHELPLSGDMVATEPCRLVTFDPDALRRLAVEAPPEVVAVLDRLE
jgi:CRP-like cAMP-binding protein